MADRLTIGELMMHRIVTHQELQAVVDGLMADPQPGWWEITYGISVETQGWRSAICKRNRAIGT
ncbi:hypothetical protein [Methylobacterium oryzisoli]|uniref:hypothetical protein n=1 Tax=Methylobacterium oryzisoli TaxID=3385502 RepID=UPI00389163F0